MKEATVSVADLLFPAQYRRKALTLLLLRPDEQFHAREIARLTDASPGAMAKELDQLQRTGLLERTAVGNQARYAANRQHPVFPELSALLKKTVGLRDVLSAALIPLADKISVAFVFGSVASATEHAGSDVDIAVIGDLDFAAVLDALLPAQDVIHREINPKVYSREEWRGKRESGSTFIRELIDKPKIFVIGVPHDLDVLG
jgi:predicted nucleotidyltransferase